MTPCLKVQNHNQQYVEILNLQVRKYISLNLDIDMIPIFDRSDSIISQQDSKTIIKADSGQKGIFREGIVEKKSPKLFVGFQKRFLVLSNNILSYYLIGKQKKDPKGMFNFDQYRAQIILKKNTFKQNSLRKSFNFIRISFLGCSRTFKFQCKTSQQSEAWYKDIKYSIQNSQGYREGYKIVTKKFQKLNNIIEKDLANIVQTGDIILFRSKSFNAKLQRVVTSSQYVIDHVGMFMHFKEMGLFVFQATVSEGVGLTAWTDLRPYIPQIYQRNRVAFRKLNMERSPQRMKKLESFLHEAYGKQYYISFKKLRQKHSIVVRKGSYTNPEQSQQSILTDDRTFFCSELVLKAYKEMNIIQTPKSSAQFYPVNFTMKKQLPFVDGVSLGVQQIINVDLSAPTPESTE